MNTFQKFSVAAASAILALGVSTGYASAAALTWTVGGDFVGGGRVKGSFTYDADTNTYGDVSISTSAGNAFFIGDEGVEVRNILPATYNDSLGVKGNAFQVRFYVDKSLSRYISLAFQRPLTNAGGAVELVVGNDIFNFGSNAPSYEYYSFYDTSGYEYPGWRSVYFGTVIAQPPAVPVPVPSAVFGVVVAGGALVARQRKNAKAKQTVA